MLEAQPARRQRVVEVAHAWADSLIDQTGRNQLLFCRDRGKLLLDDVPDVARLRLLSGRKVRLAELFPEPAEHARAAKVLEKIRTRIREYDEEQGVRVGRLATAFASWKDRRDRAVRAPVLLRDVEISRGGAGFGDHEIAVSPDVEVNPVLVAHLEATFKVAVDPTALDELGELDDAVALDQLRVIYAGVPEFHIEPGLLIGTFHYAKLAMYEDLRANAEAYAANDLFAAVAGDQDAILALRRQVGAVSREQPDRTPPNDEFLVLDADPSQSYAINAAVAGRNIVIQGPPGTGKSQTIANLISTLAARGRRVLFVAEKRAAIDAVQGRLVRVGLGDLMLDLHASAASRATVYAQFRAALDAARQTRPVDQRDLHDRVLRSRDALIRHVQSLHVTREPWGVTVFELQAELLATPVAARTTVQLGRDGLTRAALEEARQLLGDLVGIDGLLAVGERGPWGSAMLESTDQAVSARDAVRALLAELPAAAAEVAELAASLGVPTPGTPGRGAWLVELCRTTTRLAGLWRDEVWQHDLAGLRVATGDRAYRQAAPQRLGLLARLRSRRLARALRRQPGGALHHELSELAALRDDWQGFGRATPPTGLASVDDHSLQQVISHLTTLRTAFGSSRWADATWADLTLRLEQLAANALGPVRAAQTREWSARLRGMGLASLLAWLSRELPGWAPGERRELADATLAYAWRSTVLDEIRSHEPGLATFSDRNHRALAAQFAHADREHIGSTAERVQRLLAERLYEVRNAKLEQEVFLDKELPRKRRLKPLRDLVAGAPDILLAAKPCWAMSPLLVSQMLPPPQLFDVVVFDEASQVLPADAVTSLARARTAVVAGDSKQLPPTTFFDERGGEEDEDDESLGADVESILDAVNRALGQSLAHEYSLNWHYRSEDARLIAFSNARFYDNRLTTFPGTAVGSPLSLHVAESAAGASSGTDDSAVAAEVARVVELALQHARQRPGDSLGIIALSLKHAQRIEDALHERLRQEPSLRGFFADDRDERHFVKNLERVQGDERDCIILSVGFGRVDGRLLRRFGPLNLEGGERRLNVAITRARRRMDVVTSFRPDELDPESVTAEGARALARFLRYADSGGDDTSLLGRARPLNPFEIDVRDRLAEAGLDIIAQWGVAGYFIDFVVRHPHRRDQMVLAIEADGASYHSTETARARDRLRQEHLERLGWRFHRIWSTEWFNNREAAVAAVLAAYTDAVARADAPPPAPSRPAPAPTAEPAIPTQPSRSGARPAIVPGTPIAAYSVADLVRILGWIRSDGLLRTDEELLREASRVLGYSRIGAKIRSALSDAIARLSR